MAEDTVKVYEIPTISDTPFPSEGVLAVTPVSSGQKDVFLPPVIADREFPQKVIAGEVIGPMLDTQAKKILGTFTFTEFGAIQVGKYEAGVSGEVKISPLGIVAKNTAGATTFSLDRETGDAYFKGTLVAGTIIAGDSAIVLETATNGNGRMVFRNSGIPAIVIGDPS